MRCRPTLIAAFACVSVSTLAAAEPPAKPAPANTPAPLEGPKVNRPANEKRTLVQRDFDGRLKRLEVEPVGAAVALLDLSAAERASADKVLLDRKAALDQLIRDNIPLVLKLQGAFQPGNNGEGQKALQQLFEKAKPTLDKGRLIDQVCTALPPSRAGEVRKLFDEYMSAAAQERMDREGKKERLGAYIAEGFENFKHEIEDSAKRVFEGGDKDFKELVRKLDLTPEQESKVQGMFLDLYANSMGKPDKGEQAKVLLKSLALLTPEQKVKLREIVAQEARDAAKAKRATKNPAQQ